jgi:hypothetical protein
MMLAPSLRSVLAAAASFCIAACSAPEPVPLTRPGEVEGAAAVRRPVPAPTPAPAIAPAPASALPVPAVAAPGAREASAAKRPSVAVVVPPDVQYVCVVAGQANGETRQTAIEFAPNVAKLCRRHPEMGPCQYERNLCRASGGRVYAAGGVEITLATEAEYDRKVMRVRFKAD